MRTGAFRSCARVRADAWRGRSLVAVFAAEPFAVAAGGGGGGHHGSPGNGLSGLGIDEGRAY